MATEVLKEFMVLFHGDGKEVEDTTEKLGNNFLSLAKKATVAIGSFFAVKKVLDNVFQRSETTAALNDLNDLTDISISKIDAWGAAAKINGGSAEGFQQSIRGLSEQMSQFAETGGGRAKMFFRSLGIEMTDAKGKARDVMSILPDLADKFSKMSRQQSLGVGRKLGLDEGTIMMLQRGRREVEEQVKLMESLGVVTKHDGEVADAYNDQLDITHRIFDIIYTKIGTAILPIFTKLLQWFQQAFSFLRAHQGIVITAFTLIAGVISAVYVPAMARAAITTLGAVLPWLLLAAAIAAVIAAVVLVGDDIYTWVNGGKSVIGEFIGSWDELKKKPGELWDEFASKFPAIASAIKSLGGLLKRGFGMEWDAAVIAFKAGGNVIKGVLSFVGDALEGIWWVIKKIAEGWGMIAQGALKLADMGLGKLGFGDKDASGKLTEASNSPLNSVTSSAIANSKTQNKSSNVTINKVEVNTKATDASGISKDIGGSLHKHLRQTQEQYDDGMES